MNPECHVQSDGNRARPDLDLSCRDRILQLLEEEYACLLQIEKLMYRQKEIREQRQMLLKD